MTTCRPPDGGWARYWRSLTERELAGEAARWDRPIRRPDPVVTRRQQRWARSHRSITDLGRSSRSAQVRINYEADPTSTDQANTGDQLPLFQAGPPIGIEPSAASGEHIDSGPETPATSSTERQPTANNRPAPLGRPARPEADAVPAPLEGER